MKFNQSFINWCFSIAIILASLTNLMQTLDVAAFKKRTRAWQDEANRRLVEFGERPIEVNP